MVLHAIPTWVTVLSFAWSSLNDTLLESLTHDTHGRNKKDGAGKWCGVRLVVREVPQ